MSLRRVRFTATARGHVEREAAWWLKNRLHTEVFAAALEHALHVVALLPGAGTPYPQAGIAGLRRLYVDKIACHLYYTFDEREVTIRALWGARRDRGPSLNS